MRHAWSIMGLDYAAFNFSSYLFQSEAASVQGTRDGRRRRGRRRHNKPRAMQAAVWARRRPSHAPSLLLSSGRRRPLARSLSRWLPSRPLLAWRLRESSQRCSRRGKAGRAGSEGHAAARGLYVVCAITVGCCSRGMRLIDQRFRGRSCCCCCTIIQS